MHKAGIFDLQTRNLTAISLPGTLSTKVTFDATPLICTLPLSAIWMFNEGVDLYHKVGKQKWF